MNFGENPYFSAGFGLAALGFAASLARKGSIAAASLARKRLICSLEIPSKDTSYAWILEWLTKNKHDPSARRGHGLLDRFRPPPADKLSIATHFKRRENGSTETSFSLIPGIGSYFFRYQDAWFYVERSREKTMIDLKSGSPWETITLSTLTRDKDLFFKMLEEARQEALKHEVGKTVIFTSYGPEWRPFGQPRRKRPFHGVVLGGTIAQDILQDVKQFLESSKWYYDRGIPYRRGYLLHGPPGSGKTTFVQCLAGELDYNICVLNLSERGMTDDRLAHLLTNTPPRSIILLEDIDAAFASRTTVEHALNQKQGISSMLTLSGLLNALDGVASSEERIIFMTTNFVDKLDPALIRPGRVDFKQLITYATPMQMRNMFIRFYGGETEALADQFLARIEALQQEGSMPNQITTAQLQGHFVFYKDNPRSAIECIDQLII